MKTTDKSLDADKPVYGIIDPDYARVFTHARIIAWQFGYACLAHGSFSRDLDLLLVPWTDNAAVPIDALITRIADVAGLKLQGEPSEKPHGRKAWTLLFPEFNDPRWVDISAFEVTAQSRKDDGWHYFNTNDVEKLPIDTEINRNGAWHLAVTYPAYDAATNYQARTKAVI